MQTRRDQLHAYRFQNQRALAALVAGEPNVAEPPMRRLTATTISGIMIAILVAVGFGLLGIVKPTSGDAWKRPGSIIVERETGARFVYLDRVLHPVLNYSSAVLAVGTDRDATVVLVDRDELSGAQRGATIGIHAIPDSLPPASALVTGPWTVCSRQQAGDAGTLDAKVSVLAGTDAGATPLSAGQGVVVSAASASGAGAAQYLLYGGQRLAIGSAAVTTALNLPGAPLQVGTAVLDGIPAGPTLQAPDVRDEGRPSAAVMIRGTRPRVGQLLHVTANDTDFLVLGDGVLQLNAFQTALLQTLRFGTAERTLPPVQISESTALNLDLSKTDGPDVIDRLSGLPDELPVIAGSAREAGGVCAIYHEGSAQPVLAVPPSRLPSLPASTVDQSRRSEQGLADAVVLPPGTAALVRSDNRSPTVFVVAEPGTKYPVHGAGVLAGFGYGSSTVRRLPPRVLLLIPGGAALDPTAARRATDD